MHLAVLRGLLVTWGKYIYRTVTSMHIIMKASALEGRQWRFRGVRILDISTGSHIHELCSYGREGYSIILAMWRGSAQGAAYFPVCTSKVLVAAKLFEIRLADEA